MQRTIKNKKIQMCEEIEKSKYLGVSLAMNGSRDLEIIEKIIATIMANKQVLKCKFFIKNTELNINETIIKSVLLYTAKSMTITMKDEEEVRKRERTILSTISGTINQDVNKYSTE